jgi:uncharacterized membrane protein
VDRDGDLETKAGIKTPLMGRTANMDAAFFSLIYLVS